MSKIYIAHFTHSGNHVVPVGYIVNENSVHNIYMKPLDLCVFGTADFFFLYLLRSLASIEAEIMFFMISPVWSVDLFIQYNDIS